jgi:hypothetical protein
MYPQITGAVAVVTGIRDLFGGSSDAERLDANQMAYDRAIAGDDSALEYLRARSIQGSNVNIGGPVVSGWATASARADAGAKYRQALEVRKVNNVAQQAGAQVQNLAGQAGFAIVPQSEIWRMLVGLAIVAVVVLVGIHLARRARSGR